LSNYTKSTNFATKDNLSPGDPLKIVRGTEIDTEFNNISTAISTKTDNSAAAITGGSITGITDLAIADGGTGASTATAAINNLLPAQTSAANKYLQSDGTNVSWDAVTLSTSDITGTLAVANGGTGVTSSTGTGNVVLSNSPTLVTPALGTPASGTATNLTGLPISTGVSGLGTGVATFLGTPSSANLASAVSDETGSGALVFANSPTLVTPALGTPSALVGTNITGTASGLTAGNVTTNANLTGAVTSVGNATSLGSFTSAQLLGALTDETGTGSAVFATSPTLVTPILGTPTSATLTNATGLPIATGVSGLGTGVATALAVNVGSAGAPVVNGGALGTPSSGTVTNLTGTASININGTVGATTPTTGAFTTVAASGAVTLSGGTANGVTYLNGSKVLTSGSALTFDSSDRLIVGGASAAIGYRTEIVSNTSGQGLAIRGRASDATGVLAWFANASATEYARIQSDNTSSLIFGTGSSASEGMRLTSTSLYTASGINVGFGTSSPNILTWNRAVTTNTASGNVAYELAIAGAAQAYFGADASNIYLAGYANKPLLIRTNNTTALTIDTAQNVGLGVTPSAWGSNYKALQIGAQTILYNAVNYVTSLNTNAYEDSAGALLRIAAGDATRYTQAAGAHAWFTAGNGSAGSVASFTQAMTLNASGGLQTLNTVSVGNATPSTSGAGITFPATQSASSDANTLDDYEQGTWTVGLTAGTSGTITTNTETGSYTKIGRQVTVNAYITVASVSSPVGLLRMTGLPFALSGTRCAVTIWPHNLTVSAITAVVGFISSGESTVVLYVYTAGNGANDMASYVQAGTNLCVSATYFAAD